MQPTPENSRDIRKLLCEQVPLPLEKLKTCETSDALIITTAIINIHDLLRDSGA